MKKIYIASKTAILTIVLLLSVNISNADSTSVKSQLKSQNDLIKNIEYVTQSVVYIKTIEKGNSFSVASGIVVNSNGYILTNSHVVSNSLNILVTLPNNRVCLATIVKNDIINDIAIIKINSNNLIPIKIANSDSIRISEQVAAVGNPLGVKKTISLGFIKDKATKLNVDQNLIFIQSTTVTDFGSSGGALINSKGELIGITTASGYDNHIRCTYSIPSNLILNLISEL